MECSSCSEDFDREEMVEVMHRGKMVPTCYPCKRELDCESRRDAAEYRHWRREFED
jgi:NAD-dependent SIR2 family protein deacetylase